MTRRLLVTVGTTSFDALIQTFKSPGVQDTLRDVSVIYQIGRGDTKCTDAAELQSDGAAAWDEVEQSPQKQGFIRLTHRMGELMSSASMMVCHGGAGSIMEGLLFQLPLLAVSNPALMNNHQKELCEAMDKEGHLLYLSGSDLSEVTLSEKLRLLLSREPLNRRGSEFFDDCVDAFESAVIDVTGDPSIFVDCHSD